jgi:hypothetical protein
MRYAAVLVAPSSSSLAGTPGIDATQRQALRDLYLVRE